MIVQKFSGAALSHPQTVANKVIPQITEQEERPVVVASAMGKTTENILLSAQFGVAENLDQTHEKIAAIREAHSAMIAELIRSNDFDEAESITNDLNKLDEITHGLSILKELTPTVQDTLLAVGERLSATIITAALRASGHEAICVDLEDLVDRYRLQENGQQVLQQRLREKFAQLPASQIPVVTGFMGHLEGGILRNIGRKYSDFTTSLVGSALNAERVEMWTDSTGIISLRNNGSSRGKIIQTISYDDACELTQGGTRIVHPFAIEPAQQAQIPIHVRNIHDPEHAGTIITQVSDQADNLFKLTTAKRGVTIVSINTPKMLESFGYLEKIAAVFAKYGVNIDFVTTSAVKISFVVGHKPHKLENLSNELSALGNVEVTNSKSTISIIGTAIQGSLEIFSTIFPALSAKGVKIHMVAMSEGSNNLNLVVDDDDLEAALEAINSLEQGK